MQDNDTEYVMRLCEQAAREQNPARLLALVKRINDLLEKDRSGPAGTKQSLNQIPSIGHPHRAKEPSDLHL